MLSWRQLLPIDFDSRSRIKPGERRCVDCSHCFNAGNRLHLCDCLLEEIDYFLIAVVLAEQTYAHCQKVLRVETRIHCLQTIKTLDQQARTDEQHERQRDLSNYKKIAQVMAARTAANILATFFERVVKIETRRFQRRYESEDNAGDY